MFVRRFTETQFNRTSSQHQNLSLLQSSPTMILNQCICQEFGHVAGADWSKVIDLMTAACAGSNNHGAVGLAANGVSEGFGDFQGKLVFRGERAKCAGHAATTCVEQRYFARV